jgi:hypothetical protein
MTFSARLGIGIGQLCTVTSVWCRYPNSHLLDWPFRLPREMSGLTVHITQRYEAIEFQHRQLVGVGIDDTVLYSCNSRSIPIDTGTSASRSLEVKQARDVSAENQNTVQHLYLFVRLKFESITPLAGGLLTRYARSQ